MRALPTARTHPIGRPPMAVRAAPRAARTLGCSPSPLCQLSWPSFTCQVGHRAAAEPLSRPSTITLTLPHTTIHYALAPPVRPHRRQRLAHGADTRASDSALPMQCVGVERACHGISRERTWRGGPRPTMYTAPRPHTVSTVRDLGLVAFMGRTVSTHMAAAHALFGYTHIVLRQ